MFLRRVSQALSERPRWLQPPDCGFLGGFLSAEGRELTEHGLPRALPQRAHTARCQFVFYFDLVVFEQTPLTRVRGRGGQEDSEQFFTAGSSRGSAAQATVSGWSFPSARSRGCPSVCLSETRARGGAGGTAS